MDPTAVPGSRFTGRVAIVTGASTRPGIGRSTARLLARQGASVVINARTEADLLAVRDELRGEGLAVVAVPGSGLDEDVSQRLVDTAVAEFGAVDLLVNTVGGTTHRGHLLDLDKQSLVETMALNTWPSLNLVQHALRQGLAERQGAVVNVTSGSPLKGTPTRGAYAAGKAALDALTRTMAVVLAAEGVRVNSVRPGLTRTRYTEAFWAADDGASAALHQPLGKITEADDVAEAIAFLLSPAARAITGVVIDVDMGDHLGGGWTPVTATPHSTSSAPPERSQRRPR